MRGSATPRKSSTTTTGATTSSIAAYSAARSRQSEVYEDYSEVGFCFFFRSPTFHGLVSYAFARWLMLIENNSSRIELHVITVQKNFFLNLFHRKRNTSIFLRRKWEIFFNWVFYVYEEREKKLKVCLSFFSRLLKIGV